jgi:folate-binding protein YgfZ
VQEQATPHRWSELQPIFQKSWHSLKNFAEKPLSAPVDNFDMTASIENLSCALPHLGVLRAQGEDAANFLHNQLTQDVLLLDADHARLAAWCNAKGRMLASFVLFKPQADEVWLICQRDVLASALKRLSMFVLRAKVKLSDASDELQVRGLIGHSLRALTSHTEAWRHVALPDGAHVVTLYPSQDEPRALWVAPTSLSAPADTSACEDNDKLWAFSDVMSGVAWVNAATAEAFVPQMLNYESVDGVNFKKGCYPGQEVVARSQFRGTLKRRAFIVSASAPMQAGQEVFSSADATQPCGLIAQAASAMGQHVAVAELQLAASQTPLHVGSANGPALSLLPLPYALRDDI